MNYTSLFLLSVIILFIACGTDASVKNIETITENNISNEINSSSINSTFPLKTALKIPVYIEGNSYRLEVVEDSEHDYKEVFSKIFEYRDKSDVLEFNIQLIQKVFTQIEFYCSELMVNEICKIPANTFSITLSKAEIRVLKKRYGINNIIDDINKALYVGKIEMVKQENPLYDYSLSVDMLTVYKGLIVEASQELLFGKSISKTQVLHWNKDKSYVYESLKEVYHTHVEVFKLENIQIKEEKKIVHAFLFSNEINNSREESITWRQKDDRNTSYTLEYIDAFRSAIVHFSKVESQFHGSFFYNNAQHINFLNETGFGIGAYSCPSFFAYVRCLIDDKSTWSTGTQIEDNATKLDETFQLYARNFIDNNSSLSDGEYLLVDSLYVRQEEILENKVTSFMVNKHYAKGTFYHENFVNKLGTYKIYRSFSALNDRVNYEAIRLDEYPNFSIQNVYKEE